MEEKVSCLLRARGEIWHFVQLKQFLWNLLSRGPLGRRRPTYPTRILMREWISRSGVLAPGEVVRTEVVGDDYRCLQCPDPGFVTRRSRAARNGRIIALIRASSAAIVFSRRSTWSRCSRHIRP